MNGIDTKQVALRRRGTPRNSFMGGRQIYRNRLRINEKNKDWNTALHLCLLSKLATESDVPLRLAGFMLDEGSAESLSVGNKAGKTPVDLCRELLQSFNGSKPTESLLMRGLARRMGVDCRRRF